MNLGVYIPNFQNLNNVKTSTEFLNLSLNDNRISDCSIFYDGIGQNPFNMKFGAFNSTDMWNFHGTLIVTFINGIASAANIANNINIIYYFGLEEKINILNILHILNKYKDLTIIANDTESAKYFHRVTGKKPSGISENYQNILDIMEYKNG